jgi:hypothetical protein
MFGNTARSFSVPSAKTRTSSVLGTSPVCRIHQTGTMWPATGAKPVPVNGGRSTNGPPVSARVAWSTPPVAFSRRIVARDAKRITSMNGSSGEKGDPGKPSACTSKSCAGVSAAVTTNPDTRSHPEVR